MITFARETTLLTWRGLRAITRVPERLLDVTIQPIVFILLFLYVFGSAIHIPHVSYKAFLFPGIIAQSLAFGIMGTGTATANDMREGVVDHRFRSMPVSRLAIIAGQVMGQLCEQLLGLLITVVLGLILGWRPSFDLAERYAPRYYVLFAAARILAPNLVRRALNRGTFTTATESR